MDSLRSRFALDTLTDDGTFAGYGSVFNNVDSHGDIVVKGAFKTSIENAKTTGNWPKMLWQHGMDDKMPVGIWTFLAEDSQGLYVEGKLALDNRRARDVYALLKMKPRPALDGLSIGYQPMEFVMNDRASKARRTLQVVNLIEVSIVISPSNPLATVRRVKSKSMLTTRTSTDAAADYFMQTLARLDKTIRH